MIPIVSLSIPISSCLITDSNCLIIITIVSSILIVPSTLQYWLINYHRLITSSCLIINSNYCCIIINPNVLSAHQIAIVSSTQLVNPCLINSNCLSLNRQQTPVPDSLISGRQNFHGLVLI